MAMINHVAGRRKLTGATLILLAAVVQPLSGQSIAADREALKRRSVEWMDAVERKDRSALEQIVASDFQLAAIADAKAGVPRAEWIKNALRMDWQNGGYKGMRIDVYGDVAVISSDYTFRVDPGEWKPAIRATAPVIDVWLRQDGQWRVQRRHLSGLDLERWVDRIAGFIAALALVGLLTLVRRLGRKRVRASAT